MFKNIDLLKPLIKPKYFIAKPNKQIIGVLKDVYDDSTFIDIGKINELSFKIPVYIENQNHELILNPNLQFIKIKFLIKYVWGNYVEWFIIDNIQNSSNEDEDVKEVICYSLPYELNNKKIDYNTNESGSQTPEQVLNSILTKTLWTVDYINPQINNSKRTFNITKKGIVDFIINDFVKEFNCIPIFNTENRKISLFIKDEIGMNRGLKFSYNKYLQKLNHKKELQNFCTHLNIWGNNDLSIENINPTGERFIFDYSAFLYPYEEDESSNVINHSDYMSDGLASKILDYVSLLDSKKGVKQITELGTNSTTLKLTAHGLVTGDWIYNKTYDESRKVTVVDNNSVTVDSIKNQASNNEIYKFKNGTFRKLYYQREEKQDELDNKNIELFILNDEKNQILDTIGIQQENQDYYNYLINYNNSNVTKTAILHSNLYYAVMCKTSSINNITIEIDGNVKNLTTDWTVIDKLSSKTSATIECSGAGSADINIIIVNITANEYANYTDVQLINKYNIYNKQNEIAIKQDEIKFIEIDINNIETQKTTLRNEISRDEFFTQEQLNELIPYIIEDNWSCELSNEIELYEAGLNEFAKKNDIKDIININIINFLECVEAQHDWDKLNIGDIVEIEHEIFQLNYTAHISGIKPNHETGDIDIILSNFDKILNDKDKYLQDLYNSIETTDNLDKNKINWDSVATNFNNRNDRVTVIPANPVILSDGTAIDHTLNADGSCDISFEWQFNPENKNVDEFLEYNIDGFIVYVHSLDQESPFIFGSTITKDIPYNVSLYKRSYILYGVPVDRYYTFGIQAYRKVDKDIDLKGVLYSDIVQCTRTEENPYHPADAPVFEGYIGDTIASEVVDKALNSVQIDEFAPTLDTPTLTQMNNGSIKLSIPKPEAEDLNGFNIWRTTSPESNPDNAVIINNIITTYTSCPANYEYIDETVENMGYYYYWVSAFDLQGNESGKVAGNPNPIQSLDSIKPLSPTDFSAIGGWGRIDLSWNEAARTKDILKYKILISDTSNFASFTTVYSFDTKYVDFGRITTATRYYRIYSVDKAGNESINYLSGSSAAKLASDGTAPNVPVKIGTGYTLDDNGGIILSFTGSNSDDAQSYKIVRHICTGSSRQDDDGGNLIELIKHLGNITHNYTDSKLLLSKYYYYSIYCIDNSGMVSTALEIPSTGAVSAIDITPPSAPVINFDEEKIGAITIGWSKPSGNPIKYRIYQYDENGANEVELGITSALTFTDFTMSTGTATKHKYKITAIDSWDNESNKSALYPASGYLLSLTPWTADDSHAPSSTGYAFTGSSQSDGSIDLVWSGFTDTESGIGGFNIWRCLTNDSATAILVGVISTDTKHEFIDYNTIHNTNYYYWISCFDNAGNETSDLPLTSVQKYITATNTQKPTTPASITAVGRTGRIDISWTNSTSNDVVSYIIEKSINNGSSYSVLTTINTNSYTDYNINETKANITANWKYRVKSVDIIGLQSESYITTSSINLDSYVPSSGSIPSAPSISTTTSEYDGSITLTLTASSSTDVEKYRIYRSENNSNYINITEISSGTLTYKDTGLKNGQSYWYKVSAVSYTGIESSLSTKYPNDSNGKKATDSLAPNPPSITAIGDLGAIRLTWIEVDEKGVTYEIWRCGGTSWSDNNAIKIATVAGSTSGNGGQGSFIDYDPPVEVATTYTYKLKAIDAWGNISEFSNVSSTATSTINFDGTIGGVPVNVLADKTAPTIGIVDIPIANIDGTITIAWNDFTDDSSGIGGYYIWRSMDDSGVNKVIIGTATQDVTSFTDKTTQSGTTYYYNISAFDKAGNESELKSSNWKSVTANDTIPPSKPSNLITNGGWGRIDLFWVAPTDKDVVSYIVRISDDSSFNDYTDVIVNSTNFIDFGRTSTETRYYRIFSKDKTGNVSIDYASISDSATIPTDNVAPNIPTIIGIGYTTDDNGGITISFKGSDSADAQMYKIVRYTCSDLNRSNDDSGKEVGLINHNGNVTHYYTESGLIKGKYYYYQVYCIDNSGMVSDALEIPTIGAVSAIDTIPPSVPIINFDQEKIGAITIGWEKVIDAVKYRIYQYDENGTNEVELGVTSALIFTDYTMSTDMATKHRYKITAIDEWDNESEKSTIYPLSGYLLSLTPWSANDSICPSSTGYAFTGSSQSDGSIDLVWSGFKDDESGVDGYNIWRSTKNDLNTAILISVISSDVKHEFIDYNTVNTTQYYYWISCFDNAGNETEILPLTSTQKYITSLNVLKPNAPTNINAVGRLGRIDIDWSNSISNNVVGYIIEKSINNGFSYSVLMTVNTNSYTDYNINETKANITANWKYRVKSVDIIGLQSESYITTSSINLDSYVPSSGSIPSAPSISTTTSEYDGSITLTLTASSSTDVEKYRIYRSENNSNYINITEISSGTLTYKDTGLKNGQSYWYKVSAVSYTGIESSLSTKYPNDSNGKKATDSLAPNPPSITAIGDLGAIRLTWIEVDEKGVTYEIWRCGGTSWSDNNAIKIATVAGSTSGNGGQGSFIDYDPPVEVATTYTYKLKAIDAWGNISEFSNVSSTATSTINFDGTIGGVPVNVLADKTAPTIGIVDIPIANIDGTITIAWNDFTDDSSGIGGYYIWRSMDDSGVNKVIIGTATQDVTSFTDKTTQSGTTYYYNISAFDKAGNESELKSSNWKSVTANDTIPPSKPSNLITNGGWGRIDLFWVAPTDKDVVSYIVRISDDSSFNDYTDVIVNSTNFIDFGRTSTETRYYRIFSKDKTGNVSIDYASISDSATIPTDNVAPNIPTIIGIGYTTDDNGGITISFKGSDSADAQMYKIVRYTCSDLNRSNDDSGKEVGLINHNGNVTHYYTESGLIKGKYYYYQVYCIDNSGMVSDALEIPTIGAVSAIDTIPPSVPIINFDQEKIGAITIGWEKVIDAVKYRIYQYDENGTNEVELGVTSALIFTDYTMSTDMATKHRYKITAIDEWDNESEKSTIYPLSGYLLSLTPWSANDSICPSSTGYAFTGSSQSDGSIDLVWSGFKDDESGVDGYNIWRSTKNDLNTAILISVISSDVKHEFIDYNTVNTTQYYYWISCFDNAGNETEILPLTSTQKYITSLNVLKPNAPTNINAVGRLGRIDIDWSNSISNNVVGYIIEKSINNGFSYSVLMTVNTNSYTDYNIFETKANITANWKYRVKAIDINGNSSTTYITTSSINLDSYVPASGVVPVTPSISTTTSEYDGSITLTIEAISSVDVEKYRIYRSENDFNGSGTYINIAEINNNTLTYKDVGLKNNQSYWYKVSAVSYIGLESSLSIKYPNDSNGKKATDSTAPSPPSDLVVIGDLGAFNLIWTEVNEKNCIYEIYRSKSGNWSDIEKIASVAGSVDELGIIKRGTYTDYTPPISNQVVWHYKIKVADAWGNLSEFSNEDSASSVINFNGDINGVPAFNIGDNIAPVQNVDDPAITLLNLINNYIQITWNPFYDEQSGIAGYNIWRYTDDQNVNDRVLIGTTGSINNTKFIDNNTAHNTVYFYWVTAYDASGNESGFPGDEGIIGNWTSIKAENKLIPQTPTNLIAIGYNGVINISWNIIDNNDVVVYEIQKTEDCTANIVKWHCLENYLVTSYIIDMAVAGVIPINNVYDLNKDGKIDDFDILICDNYGGYMTIPNEDIEYSYSNTNFYSEYNVVSKKSEIFNWRYRVRAVNSVGNCSEWCTLNVMPNLLNYHPGNGYLPGTPNKPIATPLYDGTIKIQWEEPFSYDNYIQYYLIYRREYVNEENINSGNAGFGNEGFGNTGYSVSKAICIAKVAKPLLEYIDTYLEKNKQYQYSVAAVESDGNMSNRSLDSDPIYATDLIAPNVSNLNLTATGDFGAIKLTWNEVEGENGETYEIWRSTSKTGEYNKIATIAGSTNNTQSQNSYIDYDPPSNIATTYWYKIKAVDNWGNHLKEDGVTENFTDAISGVSLNNYDAGIVVSSATFVIGIEGQHKTADYYVPAGSTSAQDKINEVIGILPEIIIETGIAVSATTNTIVLPNTSSSTHNKYIGYMIKITSGTGVGQTRPIFSYNGDTKTITILSSLAWNIIPDNTSNYKIYSNPGKIVLLEGVYTIDNSIHLKTNVSLQGQGSNTIIKIKDGASNCNDLYFFYMIYNDDNIFILQNVEISCLMLDGNKNNNSGVNSYGTYLSLYNSKINNVTVTSCLKNGISLTYAIMCDVNNNSINNCDEDGIDIAAGTANDNYCTVFNNLIDYCKNGIQCSGSTHIKVLNNTINYPQINGISLSNGAKNIYVNLNRINYSGSHGIYMNHTKFCTINNNTVLNAGTIAGDTYSGIFMEATTGMFSLSNTITNNTCMMDSSSTNKPAYGIKIADSRCIDNTVTNNILYQSGSLGDLNDQGSSQQGNGNRLNDGSWGVV